jgi:hypothetical protein
VVISVWVGPAAVVVCWITLVKMIVDPLAVVVIKTVDAGNVEATRVVVSPRVVVIRIVLPCKVLVKTTVEAGSVVCWVEIIVEASAVSV